MEINNLLIIILFLISLYKNQLKDLIKFQDKIKEKIRVDILEVIHWLYFKQLKYKMLMITYLKIYLKKVNKIYQLIKITNIFNLILTR